MHLELPFVVTSTVEKCASYIDVTNPRVVLAAGLGLSLAGGLVCFSCSATKATRYGPGPKGVPILGNVMDLPKTDDYKVYAEWAKKYGKTNFVRLEHSVLT